MNKGCCYNGSSEKMSYMMNMMMSNESFNCMGKCIDTCMEMKTSLHQSYY